MKINKKPAVIISSYDDIKNPSYGGGGAYVVHEIARRLLPEFEVTVLTGKYPSSHDEIVDGVRYQRIGYEVRNAKVGQLVFFLTLFYAMKRRKFDVWMESFTPPFGTNCLQLFTRKPVVGLVYMLVGEDMRRKYKLRFDLIEKLGVKAYTYLITPTDSVKETILHMNYKKDIQVIPHGINLNSITRADYKNRKHLLCIGRTEINQKGLDLLLKAYKKLPRNFPYDLVIAGSGIASEVDLLKKTIKEMELEKNVIIIGRVTGSEKESLFNNAIITVIPSRFETFSLVALESLAYGVPIVSFNIDGLSWVPTKASAKIKSFDADLFAAQILKLTNKTATLQSMSKAGIAYAKKHTWDEVAGQYKDYLNTIL